jgi:hypothetical protein
MPRLSYTMLLISLIAASLGCTQPKHPHTHPAATSKTESMNMSVVQYDSDYVPNPSPTGETVFEEFWQVRASVLAASQEHGETGPESKSDNTIYWIVDDQYNDERYQNMEVYKPEGWTIEWLTALIGRLREHKGWAISIGNIDQGHLLVFADRLMVTGPTFENCDDLESVVAAAKLATENFDERKNGPLLRQLEYIKTLLPSAMKDADSNTFSYLATFDGYQLHEGNAVWILQTKNDNELLLDTEYSPIRTTAVTADETIHPEYCKEFWPYTDVSPPYWLLTYVVKDRTQTNFTMVDEDGNEVGSLSIGEITTDEELKQRLNVEESE